MSDSDAYLSNDGTSSPYVGDLGITNTINPEVSALPFGETIPNVYKGVTEGDIAALTAGAGDLLGNAIAFEADPLNWLISAGLTFVIDFFQPLEDLLSLFTGNAERIEGYAKEWQRLGAALGPLADAVQQAAADHLIEWEGRDADAAKARLMDFGWGIRATGGEANSIAGLLVLFSKIMTAAQQIIIGIMATLVEWAIVTWGTALALAPETLGGSVAAAGAATGVEASIATSRAVAVVDRVVILLEKIGALLAKILPDALQGAVKEGIVGVGKAVTVKTLGQVAAVVLKDPGNYVSPLSGVAGGSQENGKTAYTEDGAAIDEALDVRK
ncbi:hypothetical protein [Actinoplanes awajinensis]|uniref:Uncharacterized protein n=1 Tax=Actinoplanes awajinensis subsp. mycoplanecinus TaxID=135947 RepID=A0A0X3V8I7_9ACTN|nr:hypothetical protein [Actinoplanes awajinensis]KUL40562.1 hypothetical protein ADL15_06105 [Actinoplanes awajinensis subsp. mycoplanecinus]